MIQTAGIPKQISWIWTGTRQEDGRMDSTLCSLNAYREFVECSPRVVQAWDTIEEAGREGPLDDRTTCLVNLGIAIGTLRQGPVQANVRKAMSSGVFTKELVQVVVLAAGTLGASDALTAFTWIQDTLEGK
jgi:alkylhydroperoxidase/carboxymuconolactone decarboxylase family protein YurZ